MKDFIMKNKGKILFILAIAILVAIVGIYAIANLPKKVAIEQVDEEIKASVEEVPEGYVGITDAQGLKDMANDLAGNYILMADIDMEGEEWTPIGLNASSAFTGILEGNYHTISNLTISSSNQYVGMFGYINGGTAQNLILENVNVTSTFNSDFGDTGALVGYSKGTITNVEVGGTIIGVKRWGSFTGGIIGYNLGAELSNLTNKSTVTGYVVGGVVGYSETNIIESTNRGDITGTYIMGGIVGQLKAEIVNVENNGTVTGIGTNNSNIGGIVGRSEAGITNARNNGTVTSIGATSYLGGIVGESFATITNVENNGTVIGTSSEKVGGIAGRQYGAIRDVTNNGTIQRKRNRWNSRIF